MPVVTTATLLAYRMCHSARHSANVYGAVFRAAYHLHWKAAQVETYL